VLVLELTLVNLFAEMAKLTVLKSVMMDQMIELDETQTVQEMQMGILVML